MSFGRVFILGDSYSTYEGWNPKEYPNPYYSDKESDFHDLDSVEQTWWHMLLERTGSTLVRNDGYSGTTICTTGYNGQHCVDTYFAGRLEKLISQGFFRENPIDTLFIFGGTNDTWAHSPVGEIQTENFTEEDLKKVAPAMCYLLDLIRRELPGVRVVVIVNHEVNPAIAEAQFKAAEIYGAECIKPLRIDKISGHPSRLGMKKLADQLIAGLL